ncbi:MAG: AmmeMemoRadiSam system protein B [Planctomycetota bacterium]|jgi:AmmeMemoRadiSam system protein B|nr:AmmeMemoRadiSam system protein B [Planctomycetota bacterium]
MPETYPKLRNEIDAAPADGGSEPYFIVYDRSGVAPTRLFASPFALLVASRLDGNTSILEIADQLGRETGDNAFTGSEVEKIVDALDEALFIDDSRFHDFREQADRDFRSSSVRLPGSAGSAYPESGVELAEDLDQMLADAPPPEEFIDAGEAFPRAVIVPHIDFTRGAPGYGQVYKYLSTRAQPRTVIVLGTAHLPLSQRFTLCEKDFQTPLGLVRTDREACGRIRDALAGVCDPDIDVLAHRGEHSVELQAVWLRHIYGADITIVPILAGSIGEFIEDRVPDPKEAVNDGAIQALTASLGEFAQRGDVMIMASADLSHIGPRFGDEREISTAFLAEVEETDREYLSATATNPVEGLRRLAAHGDRYHVCGSAPIFLAVRSIGKVRGKLLGYHQAPTPEMRQAVTYASMVFH